MQDENHTCPRRAETGRDNPDSPFVGSGTNLDTWRTGGGLVTQGSIGTSCSYCGSLNPDRFMELVREGWVVGPTDKSYKVYLGQPLSDDERAARKAEWLQRFAAGPKIAEQNADLEAAYDRDHAFPQSKGGAKFYLQHLGADQQNEFIDLVNRGRMVMGEPGYFYQLPFFTTRRTEQGGE